MATIDKQSVRAEFDKIKVGFDEQVKAGKVSTEVAMLVNTLMLLFNLVLSIFVEKSTKKTSANSSIPPSQTTPDNTSITTKSKTDDDQNKQKTVTVASSGDITLKFLHQKRGKKAIEAIGIIPHYGGTIVHDCWASYLSYDHLKHGLCGGHLLRELTFIIDSNGYRWAKNMKRLLKKACKMVSSRKEKCLIADEYLKLTRLYRKIIAAGEKELPAIPEKTTKRRGKVAKSDAHNLWNRLKKYEASVLLFSKLPHLSFTNNRAERDLCMAKVKQKVSGCFRTEKYAQVYCRISSYLQTMKNKDINPLVAISKYGTQWKNRVIIIEVCSGRFLTAFGMT